MIEREHWALRGRVSVSGGDVATGVHGSAGRPIVLVHGTPASSFLWRNVVPLLARRHTVYLWDLLGFGNSRLALAAEPSIAQQAKTLAELVGHWGLEDPVLVGHDIGGGTVVRAHLVEQVPAARLVLMDAAVLGPWNTAFTEHMQTNEDVYRTMPADAFGDLIAGRLRSATAQPMTPEVHASYMAPWEGTAGQGRWVDQVASVGFHDTEEAVGRLGEINAPTLVLWGDGDTWLEPSVGDRLAAAIPNAKRETVAGAGHFLPEDAPEATAESILRFLDDAAPTPLG